MDVRRGGRTGKAAAGAEGVGRPRRDTARLAGVGYPQLRSSRLRAPKARALRGLRKIFILCFPDRLCKFCLAFWRCSTCQVAQKPPKTVVFFFLWYILLWCDYFTAYEPLPIKQNIYFVQLIHTDTQCLQPKKYLILSPKRGKIITRSGIDGCCNNGVVMRAAY